MPGLRLTEPQVERLCSTTPSMSASALRALVSAGFLTPLPDGSYARADAVTGPPAAARAGRRYASRRDAPGAERRCGA